MPMDGHLLAQEVLQRMGGQVTPDRLRAFENFCQAIVEHIQKYALVSGTVTTPVGGGGGTIDTPSTKVF